MRSGASRGGLSERVRQGEEGERNGAQGYEPRTEKGGILDV